MEIKKGKYKHYKGKFYRVLGVGRHSETLEEVVVYQALYDVKVADNCNFEHPKVPTEREGLFDSEFGNNAIWVRPKKMFLEEVVVDGKKVKRFEFVGESQ